MGPFLVVAKPGEVTYSIQRNSSSNILTVHVDHLKPYVAEKLPKRWMNKDRGALEGGPTETDSSDDLVNQDQPGVVCLPEVSRVDPVDQCLPSRSRRQFESHSDYGDQKSGNREIQNRWDQAARSADQEEGGGSIESCKGELSLEDPPEEYRDKEEDDESPGEDLQKQEFPKRRQRVRRLPRRFEEYEM